MPMPKGFVGKNSMWKAWSNSAKYQTRKLAKDAGKELVSANKTVMQKNIRNLKRGAAAFKNPTAKGYINTLGSQFVDSSTGGMKKGAWGAMGKNLRTSLTKDGGGFWNNYGKQMAIGAGVNAGISGTSEWAQGGSFWEGAKSGAVSGALYGAAYGGVKSAMGMPGANGTIGGVSSRVSKQVQAMFVNQDSVNDAMKMMQKGSLKNK
jgi:hypothetical protein